MAHDSKMRMETVFTIKLLKIAGWQLFDQGEIGEWTNCAWVGRSLRVGQTCGKHVVRFECQEKILLCLAWRRLPHQTLPRAPSLRVVARDGLRIGDGSNPEKRLGKRSGRRRTQRGRGLRPSSVDSVLVTRSNPAAFATPPKLNGTGGGGPLGHSLGSTGLRGHL